MNIRNFITTMLLAGTIAGFVSCEDSRNEFLEDYQTMVYFRNGGEQDITLYRVGEDNFYEIPICKSGRNLEGTATAVVVPLNQTQLDIYNLENNTDYKALEQETCWYFVQMENEDAEIQPPIELTFGPDDTYQVIKIRLKVDAINTAQNADLDYEHVIALQVYADPKVSDDVNIIILRPEIDIPRISLNSSGMVTNTFTIDDPMTYTYSNNVRLGLDNRWDFNATLTIGDAQWVNDYNSENGTEYYLLPTENYTLSTADGNEANGNTLTLPFTSGNSSSAFTVQLNRENMDDLREYVLPITLTSSSKTEFEVNQASRQWILYFRQDPDFIALNADMLSSPYEANSGDDAVANLADGDEDTYWGSFWGGRETPAVDPRYGQYINITLEEELTHIIFSYSNRGYANGAPTHIVIGVSNDPDDLDRLSSNENSGWKEIGEVTSGLPTGSKEWVTLPMFKSDTPFKYVRFGVAASLLGSNLTVNSGTNMGNIRITGADLSSSSSSGFSN